jgi:alkylation response protein AidB-like acyl-CoA dehydrogenase
VIEWSRQEAQLFILIGRKDLWHLHYGTSALVRLLDEAFTTLELHRVWVDVPEYNEHALQMFRHAAAELFDAGKKCAAEANMAKLLASEASAAAGEVCIQTHGGYGFAEEYDIERKYRETRLYQVAPVSSNLILSYVGTHVLGMPKSF